MLPSPKRPRRGRLALLLAAALLATAAGLASARARPPIRGLAPEPAKVVREFSLRDTRGKWRGLAEWREGKGVAILFLGTDCPISNGLAPEMGRLAAEYGPRGVAFCGVHADPDVTDELAETHASEFGLKFPILLDPTQELAAEIRVAVAPTAILLDPEGRIFYRGRIDDRFSAPGKGRGEPTTHDLRDALDALLAGKAPKVPETKAVGCPLPKPAARGPSAAVTYNRDIAPIVLRKCASCHRPGEVGPFPLLTFKDAARRAPFVREMAESRRMPPWKPEPGWGAFLDDPRLTDRETYLISRWVEAGTPEGDPADLPATPTFPNGWRLGDPDLVAEMPEPFPIPADGPDLYRAFVLPIPGGADLPVVALEFRPGNRKVVHHAKLFEDPTGTSRKRDLADPAPGFASMGSGDIGRPALCEWTPGTLPRRSPPGVGKVFKAGSDLILFLHYHPDGKAEVDRSQVGIFLSKTPLARQWAGIPLGTGKIDIPAGARGYEVQARTTLPVDVHAYAVMPHAHYLLREMKVRAILPDGLIRRLLSIKDWDFNWQGQYHFAEPVALPAGTVLELIGTYDNSSANPRNPSRPPKRVRFGPTSLDEMLGCHIQVIPDRPEGHDALRRKWPRGL